MNLRTPKLRKKHGKRRPKTPPTESTTGTSTPCTPADVREPPVCVSPNEYIPNVPLRKTNVKVCVRIRPLLTKGSKTSSSIRMPSPARTTSSSTTSSPHRTTSRGKTKLTESSEGVRKQGRLVPYCTRKPRRTPASTTVIEQPNYDPILLSSLKNSALKKPSFKRCLPRSPAKSAWEVSSTTTISRASHKKLDQLRRTTFTYDRVYDTSSATIDIYNESVRDIVLASVADGYHGSIFAYGQTATGKTYTMHGDSLTSSGSSSSPGVVSYAVEDCFRYIKSTPRRAGKEKREYLLRVSYMEIYNEKVTDLLADRGPDSSSSPGVMIYDGDKTGDDVIVRNLTEEVVTNPEQVMNALRKGNMNRKIGRTALNDHSSRSHTIFRIVFESRVRGGPVQGVPVRVSTLNFVDLAGSECAKASGTTGRRLKEGHYINKSLLTLGNVISKLSEMASRPNILVVNKHIPYRDSKLTRLLQPSLQGNAQIAIIFNVSAHPENVEDTIRTLKFAKRAKKIKQKPTVTEVGNDESSLLKEYREEIAALKEELNIIIQARNEERRNSDMDWTDDDCDIDTISKQIRNLERLILKSRSATRGGSTSPARRRRDLKKVALETSSSWDVESIDDMTPTPSSISDITTVEKLSPKCVSAVSKKTVTLPKNLCRDIECESTQSSKDFNYYRGIIEGLGDKLNAFNDKQRNRKVLSGLNNQTDFGENTPLEKHHMNRHIFYSQQLNEFTSLLKEVSQFLHRTQERQEKLHQDNVTMKLKLVCQSELLMRRDAEIKDLKKKVAAHEEMFSNLV